LIARRRALAATLVLVAGSLGTVSLDAAPARAGSFAGGTVTLVGHGYGHGRGMGQFGAFGYAVAGKSYSWIVDHYYGGTTEALVAPGQSITVDLSAFDGRDTMVQLASANLAASWPGGSVSGQAALRVSHTSGVAQVWTAPSCAGPWVAFGAPTSGDVTITSAAATGALSDLVQTCNPDASRHWYGGTIVAKASAKTYDVLALEEYVADVVPRESIAAWGQLGGEEALKAQAVAARSYGIARAQTSGGVMCDTPYCQSYVGRAVGGTTPTVDVESGIYATTSLAAAQATVGQVRCFVAVGTCPTASVAATEFSSSTGGYSAGGTFAAVPDDGDATPSNSLHTWSVNIPVASIEAAYPSIGTLQSIVVRQRNGLGDLGGRVLQLSVVGRSGTVDTTGDGFAAQFNLYSNWFAVTNQLTGPSGGVDGYWLVASDGGVFSFGNAAFHGSTGGLPLVKPVVGMAATPSGQGYWLVASDGGIFSYGDAAFHGSTGGLPLVKPVVGLSVTSSGQGYWLVASDGGIFAFGDAAFHGSTGGLELDAPIVAMAATPSGRGYWLVASDGGIFAFGDAVFYGSMGGHPLNQPIVGMSTTSDGRGYTLVARDGGVFDFGDASFAGSGAGNLPGGAAALGATADGQGYLIAASSGSVFNFGDAPFLGDVPSVIGNYQGHVLGLAVHHGS